MNTDDHADHRGLTPARLEAFSDGVLAIIITIAVLEFKLPASASLAALMPVIPHFIAYAVSFQTIGTYWNNHHILLRATRHIAPDIMWANLHLLFWLSLIPFATAWVGASPQGAWPTALYAIILLASAIAYTILQFTIVRHSDRRAELMAELGSSKKGLISLLAYTLATLAAFLNPLISDTLILLVALIWFVPDRRIAKYL